MQTFYFFTTSLNFGNIFSSESISPESFYTKRGFGFDYFENFFPNINDYIVLFEQFPAFELPKSNETDSYKIVIEIELPNNQLQKTEKEGVWLCSNTIYLSLKNLKKVYFSTENELMRVVAKAESSKSLKTLKKYIPLFDFSSATIKPKTTYNVSDLVVSKANVEVQISRDKFFNNFKGFVYGILCGQASKKNPEEIAYIKNLQEIKNHFALLKNSLAHNSFNFRSDDKKKYDYKSNDYNATSEIMKNLKKSIEDSERLFKSAIDNYGSIDYVNGYLTKIVFKSFEGSVDENVLAGVKHFSKFMRGVDNNLEREARNWFWETNPENPFILYQTLKYSVQSYKETKNKERQEDYDSDILKALFKLEKYAEQKFLEKSKNINVFDFSSLSINGTQIKISNPTFDEHYESIANILLANPKQSKGKVSDNQLLPFVEQVGNLFSKGNGKSSNLYKYLTKQDLSYHEKAETPIVIKNFTAFIFNPNDIDKLQKYIEEKHIAEPQYAFSFFCLFNGFASLSKDFAKSIIENTDLQEKLDLYFSEILIEINKAESFFRTQEITNSIPDTEPTYESIMEASKNTVEWNFKTTEQVIENQEIQKIDLQELKEEILLKSKQEKLFKEGLETSLDKSLIEINKLIDRMRVPFDKQKQFVKSRLMILLMDKKYKLPNFAEKSIQKLCNLIDEK